MDAAQFILTIDSLRVEAISGAVLVDDVSLALRAGEVLGLIGESGAGKSTIGLAAMAYARPGCRITGGTIELGGQDLRMLDAAGRRRVRGARVAYIAQSAAASFDPSMTLMDQVCEAPVRHRLLTRVQAEARARELFTALDLPQPDRFGARYPHQASGGQLQRAMAAMAMACRPDVLVLDEPTTALDVTTQIEVLSLLRELIRSNGTAALYITHDLAVVAQVADRITVLRHGKVVESGDTGQMLSAPQTPYAAALVAERRAATAAPLTQAADAPAVLTVDRLFVRYGAVVAVKDVSLVVARGETVAVVGESGSGKSTLANAIIGQTRAASGELRFRGDPLPLDVRGRDTQMRSRLQMVHQLPDVALNPRQSIGSIVGRPIQFFRGVSGRDLRGRVAELLELVGLPPAFAGRLPGQLSGGQKQRVCIARALAAEPELVICDEVTSALDPLVAEEILKLLQGLQDRLGVSYLFITHDLGTVRRVAHRVAVMLRGELVEEGAVADIFEAPQQAYTRSLLASVPAMRPGWLDEALARREGVV